MDSSDRMPGMRTLLATVFLLTMSAVQASANTTVKQYKIDMAANGPASQFTKIYIFGVGEGYLWYNIAATFENRKPLYCPPQKLSLSAENYKDIIDRQIAALATRKTQVELDEMSIAMILLDGLRETFPCANK